MNAAGRAKALFGMEGGEGDEVRGPNSRYLDALLSGTAPSSTSPAAAPSAPVFSATGESAASHHAPAEETSVIDPLLGQPLSPSSAATSLTASAGFGSPASRAASLPTRRHPAPPHPLSPILESAPPTSKKDADRAATASAPPPSTAERDAAAAERDARYEFFGFAPPPAPTVPGSVNLSPHPQPPAPISLAFDSSSLASASVGPEAAPSATASRRKRVAKASRQIHFEDNTSNIPSAAATSSVPELAAASAPALSVQEIDVSINQGGGIFGAPYRAPDLISPGRTDHGGGVAAPAPGHSPEQARPAVRVQTSASEGSPHAAAAGAGNSTEEYPFFEIHGETGAEVTRAVHSTLSTQQLQHYSENFLTQVERKKAKTTFVHTCALFASFHLRAQSPANAFFLLKFIINTLYSEMAIKGSSLYRTYKPRGAGFNAPRLRFIDENGNHFSFKVSDTFRKGMECLEASFRAYDDAIRRDLTPTLPIPFADSLMIEDAPGGTGQNAATAGAHSLN